MTLKEAQRMARAHGISIRKTSAGDFKISVIGRKLLGSTYEESVQDALDTAKEMYRRLHKR